MANECAAWVWRVPRRLGMRSLLKGQTSCMHTTWAQWSRGAVRLATAGLPPRLSSDMTMSRSAHNR